MTFPANDLARITGVKTTGYPDLETPRDFERFLREQGFSRTRAKAITAKGFGGFENHADEALIAEMVAELKARKERLEGKGKLDVISDLFKAGSSIGTIVSLFPGQAKTLRLPKVKLGNVIFGIKAPSYVNFSCSIEYYEFNSRTPSKKQIELWANENDEHLKEPVSRGKPPSFDPLKLQDWVDQFPEQLLLDSTKATITYHSSRVSSVRRAPHRAARFEISVS